MQKLNNLWQTMQQKIHDMPWMQWLINQYQQPFWQKKSQKAPQTPDQPRPDFQKSTHSAIKAGLTVLVILIGGFTLWSVFFPLESAAVAPGKIIVESHSKVIQHLEGGIVKAIAIKEGAMVKKNQVLMTLETTLSHAQQKKLLMQQYALQALQARLMSERDEQSSIHFPEKLIEAAQGNSYLHTRIQAQQKEFEATTKTLKGTIAILEQRITQMRHEITSLASQQKSADEQLLLITKEIDSMRPLVKKQFIPLSRFYALQREQSRLKGERDEKAAQTAQMHQKIGETQLSIIHQKNTVKEKVLTELRKTQETLADIEQSLHSATDILKRTTILSPRAGQVLGLKVHTIGAVIKPGETIMRIVPTGDELVIEARINPLDIDIVKQGLKAKVQLSAFKMRQVPTLSGILQSVSGDVFQDEHTGENYYLANVVIHPEEIKSKNIDRLKLYPGMPVQVMIITGKHSLFNYLIIPLKESLNRAFRES